MKNPISLLLVFALVISTAGCATIFGQSGENDVNITSEPKMSFLLKSAYGQTIVSGKTPKLVRLAPSENYSVIFTSPQGEKIARPIVKRFNGVGILNIFFPIGFLIDYLTGALFTLPPAVHIERDDQ